MSKIYEIAMSIWHDNYDYEQKKWEYLERLGVSKVEKLISNGEDPFDTLLEAFSKPFTFYKQNELGQWIINQIKRNDTFKIKINGGDKIIYEILTSGTKANPNNWKTHIYMKSFVNECIKLLNSIKKDHQVKKTGYNIDCYKKKQLIRFENSNTKSTFIGLLRSRKQLELKRKQQLDLWNFYTLLSTKLPTNTVHLVCHYLQT